MFNLFYMNALVQGQSSSLLFATETHQAQAPLKLINVNKNYIFNRLGFHIRIFKLTPPQAFQHRALNLLLRC